MYHTPGPYSEFVSQFSEVLSSLVFKTDKVIIVVDFNIDLDVDDDSPTTVFISLLDSTSQNPLYQTII